MLNENTADKSKLKGQEDRGNLQTWEELKKQTENRACVDCGAAGTPPLPLPPFPASHSARSIGHGVITGVVCGDACACVVCAQIRIGYRSTWAS
jgi:hypothetical protein